MEVNEVINMVGQSCRPDQEAKLIRWYDEEHIPDLMGFRPLKRSIRCEMVLPENQFEYIETKYPKYLNIYEFVNQQAFEEYNDSWVKKPRPTNSVEATWGKDPVIKLWRVHYRVVKVFGENGDDLGAGRVIKMVGQSCRPDQEEKLTRWYDEEHIPDLMQFRPLKRSIRCEMVLPENQFEYMETKYPKYLNIYEFENQQAFEEYNDSWVKKPRPTNSVEATWGKDPVIKLWRVHYKVVKVFERKIG